MIPASAIADAKAAQTQTGASGLAAALALAVAGPETGHSYDPGSEGDYMLNGRLVARGTPGAVPTSFGYTQLHTNAGGDGGGLGNGYSVGQLTDGVTNFAIAMRDIQNRLDAGASPYDALAPWTTRDQAMGQLSAAAAALGAAIPRGISTAGDTQTGGLVLLAIAGLVLLALVEG